MLRGHVTATLGRRLKTWPMRHASIKSINTKSIETTQPQSTRRKPTAKPQDHASTNVSSGRTRRRSASLTTSRSTAVDPEADDAKAARSSKSGHKESTAHSDDKLATMPSTTDTTRPKRRRVTKNEPRQLISLSNVAEHHSTLTEYLAYAEAKFLDKGSKVYNGTVYEYTVMEALGAYGFELQRIGRRNDLGIDHLGCWHLPTGREFNVLIQCKASTPKPSMIRELEGAFAGAPARWRSDNVMAFLITSHPATLGVRESLRRSMLPMGFAQITTNGNMQQFLWNHAAEQAQLTGLSVTSTYSIAGRRGDEGHSADSKHVKASIALLWMGKQWRSSRLKEEKGKSSAQSAADLNSP